MNEKKLYRYKINDIKDMKFVKVEYEDQNVLIIDDLANLSDGDAARLDCIMVFLCRSGSISSFPPVQNCIRRVNPMLLPSAKGLIVPVTAGLHPFTALQPTPSLPRWGSDGFTTTNTGSET